MNLYFRLIGPALLEQVMEWRWKTSMSADQQVEYHWTEFHLSIVHRYFALMHDEIEFRGQPSSKLFDDALFNTFTQSSTYYAKLVASFVQELQEFFTVPKLSKPSVYVGIKKYQVLEVFIIFLLQLLRNRTASIDSLKHRIDNLDKELRFLLTVLGDPSLQLYDDQETHVSKLLEEFEAVANEAGSLVHSLLFSTGPVSAKMDRGLTVILNHIDLLKANIMKFLNLLPLSSRAVTPKTSVVDSLLILDSLLHDLEVLIKREDDPIADVKDQINMLHRRLVILQSCIEDIREPQISETRGLKELFLMRIGDLACEAEYLVISFLVGDAPPAYLIIRLTDVIGKIEFIIGTELQEIKKKCEIGALKVTKHEGAQLPLQAKRNPEFDSITVGLEDKEIHLLKHLLGETRHLQIVTIIGMPGLGKTTLAKKLYNHPLVSYKFDKCSFCVISQSYKKKSALLDILNSSTKEMSNMGEESLVELIYKSLKGRRYLVVMDDMWDSNVWVDLRRCFPDDENGSRILITSRNKDVAPPNAIIYDLPSLTNDECWDLLEKKVFDNKPCPDELLGIGMKIASNCHGVPLAVVAVAGILSTMDKKETQWKKVGENIASFIFEGGDDTVMQILELSYKHLPEHLKRCFLYFGAFSKYKEIPVRELMRLWIAEGFIRIRDELKKSAESVAEEYLMELIDKNLAIVSKRRSDGGLRACIIHDLLRDLCLRKCEEENFLKFVDWINSPTILSKSHRLIFHGDCESAFNCGQNLRSIHASSQMLLVYASNMKLLRVLKLDRRSHNGFFGMEFLVCLRYLVTKELPACIGCFVSLEFLVVETSKHGVVIPSVILKMMKLRCLQISKNATYDADCNSSQRNNLEFLSTVNIYSLRDEETLKSSPHLRKLKCRCNVLKDKEKGEYRYPDLRFLTQLESLTMKVQRQLEIAEIYFPPNIKKLSLNSSGLPWEKIMQSVGRLPKLEVLKLAYEDNVGETWETRDGEFQRLKFLKLEFVCFNQWIVASNEHFPRLQQLVLSDCYNLEKIPSEIGEIGTLQLIEVRKCCPKSLVESARNIQEEQHEMGNEELRVIIKEAYDD